MCAAVGFPVLRLVRVAIGQLTLGDLKAGGVKSLPRQLIFQQLGLAIRSPVEPLLGLQIASKDTNHIQERPYTATAKRE